MQGVSIIKHKYAESETSAASIGKETFQKHVTLYEPISEQCDTQQIYKTTPTSTQQNKLYVQWYPRIVTVKSKYFEFIFAFERQWNQSVR